MRRGVLHLGAAACLAGWLAWHYGVVMLPHDAAMPALPIPEDGMVVDGAYRSEYFGLTYPLPQGWMAGASGPAPSQFGDYVLGTLVPEGETTGTILITAQDMFFADEKHQNATSALQDFRRSVSEIAGMTIDREPSELRISGRAVHRVDFSGVGLHRAMFALEIRCHVVTFNLTTRDPDLLARLARSLDDLDEARRTPGLSVPECVRDYAVADNIVHRVEPADAGTKAASIPVRIVVAQDGSVKQVHVIRATAAQRRNIEEALHQWKFKPYLRQGRAVDIETGVLIKFKQIDM
jgi:hypothetical protein